MPNPERFLFVPCSGSARFVDVNITDDHREFLDTCHDLLNCDCIENVYFGNQYIMIVDDVGKLRRKPVNRIGTILYRNSFDCIVGNVLIGARVTRGEYNEEDIGGLSPTTEAFFRAFLASQRVDVK